MRYELYEIWSEDKDGHEELIETTGDRRQALQIAQKSKAPDLTIIVYRETEDGELEEIEVLE